MDEKMSDQLTENTIYTDMLMPLKNKISQILLYDTNAAAKFLTMYNEITAKDTISTSELMGAISDLEISLQDYENSTGKEKYAEEKGKVLSKNMKDLSTKAISMSAANFEAEFLKFRKGYDEEIVKQTYGDRDKLDQQFHSLQAELITRKIAETKGAVDLSSVIKEEDKVGLSIWVRNKAIELKENSKYSEFANKINETLLLKEDAVMIPELWKWIEAAEKGKNIENQTQNIGQETTALAPIREEKKIGFWGKVAKTFSSKPSLPLDIKDIKKIKPEWLSEQIPKEMWLEEDRQRLEKEGKVADEMHTPSGVYVFMKKMEKIFGIGIKHNYGLLEEGGKAKTINVWQEDPSYLKDWAYVNRDSSSRIVVSVGAESQEKKVKGKMADILNYAELIDKVCGSGFKQELLQEMKLYYFDRALRIDEKTTKFESSLEKLSSWYESERLNIVARENEQREKFYREHPLKDKENKKPDPIVIHELPKEKPNVEQNIERNDAHELR